MGLSALLVSSGVAIGVAVAGSALFVWFYNRVLAGLREVWFKKFISLAVLPLGVLLGLAGFARFVFSDPAGFESWTWGLSALAGWAVVVRYSLVSLRWNRLQKDSVYQSVPCPGGGIQWVELNRFQRCVLIPARPVNEAEDLRLHRRRVPIAGLPAEFEGYRIVHLTDFHIHQSMRADWYRHVVKQALALAPDLILFGGDFISKPPNIPRIPEIFAPLEAPDGVLFVRGNHDFWRSPRRIARLAESAGMRLLENEGIEIRRGRAVIALIGLETPYVPISPAEREALRRLPTPRIVLVHTPDAFAEAARLGGALAFAGHTHGGQVRLPLFGTTISSIAAGPLFTSGFGRLGNMTTVTSNGQGAFLPLRYRCPPEIVVAELTRAEDTT